MSDWIIGGIIGLLFVGAIILFVLYLDWTSSNYKESPKISFEDFKMFYLAFPSKWSLFDNWVRYSNSEYTIVVEFKHFSDYIKYILFYDKVERDKKKSNRNEKEELFARCMQEELNEYLKNNLGNTNPITRCGSNNG